MITFLKLGQHGNIGNAMFQLAATVSAARKNNYEVKIPKHSTYFNPDTGNNIISLFEGFNIKIPIITDEEIKLLKYTYSETDYHYNFAIENIQDFTNLHGYFQTEKYFSYIKKEINNLFEFNANIVNKSRNLFKALNIEPEHTVSLHVRRGDYLKKEQFHPQQPVEYFMEAYKLSKLDYVLIFSDDIEWCKKNIKSKNIHFSENNCPFTDLKAMSLCKNNIITNSTFSWWGAYLNANKNKKVIAPKNWFGPALAHYKTTDLIPYEWIQL